MFRKAQIKIAMMKEKNGLKKLNPFFWKAAKPIYIPEENSGEDHGRPIIILNGDEPEQKMILVLFRDRLVAQYPDRSERTLQLL